MRYGEHVEGIKYIEVTKERYCHVKTNFKYVSFSFNGRKHFYLATNRLHLDNKLRDSKNKKIKYWEDLLG